MRIKLATPLIGEFPRYANVKLPDNAAVIAQNMRLDSGVQATSLRSQVRFNWVKKWQHQTALTLH